MCTGVTDLTVHKQHQLITGCHQLDGTTVTQDTLLTESITWRSFENNTVCREKKSSLGW